MFVNNLEIKISKNILKTKNLTNIKTIRKYNEYISLYIYIYFFFIIF